MLLIPMHFDSFIRNNCLICGSQTLKRFAAHKHCEAFDYIAPILGQCLPSGVGEYTGFLNIAQSGLFQFELGYDNENKRFVSFNSLQKSTYIVALFSILKVTV